MFSRSLTLCVLIDRILAQEFRERRRQFKDHIRKNKGFDLPMFVEVLTKVLAKGDEANQPGLTELERYMGVPSW